MCDFHMHVSLLAASLKRSHVRLLAIDFDDTLLNLHTHSRWELGPNKLADAVRPFFMELIPAVLRKGIIVSVVTFSSQRRLIQQTLREAFGQTVARQILIRGNDGSWTPTPTECAPKSWQACSRRGKTDHILSVVSKIYTDSDVEVTPEQVLLVDDARLNVMQARYDGINAYQYDSSDSACGQADESNPLFQLLIATFRGNPRKGRHHVPAWATDAGQSPVAPSKQKVHSGLQNHYDDLYESVKPGPRAGDDIPASVDDTVSLNSGELRDCWETEELALMDIRTSDDSVSVSGSCASSSSNAAPLDEIADDEYCGQGGPRDAKAFSALGSRRTKSSLGGKPVSSTAQAKCATRGGPEQPGLARQPDEWNDNPFARRASRRHCLPRPDACTVM